MKTVISLPHDVFASADALAERLGVSRGEIYARAVEEYVARHRGGDVTARLNRVGADADEAERQDPTLRRAQARSLASQGDDPW